MVYRGRVAKWLMSLATLVMGSACSEAQDLQELQREIREKFPAVSQISVEHLQASLVDSTEEMVVLDTRATREYEVSHLPTALLATDLEMARRVLGDVPKERKIVLYCSVGYRSSALAEQLTAAGYTNVHNLEGSIFAWANQGLPLYRGENPVAEVHPYDRRWGRYLHAELWAW